MWWSQRLRAKKSICHQLQLIILSIKTFCWANFKLQTLSPINTWWFFCLSSLWNIILHETRNRILHIFFSINSTFIHFWVRNCLLKLLITHFNCSQNICIITNDMRCCIRNMDGIVISWKMLKIVESQDIHSIIQTKIKWNNASHFCLFWGERMNLQQKLCFFNFTFVVLVSNWF